MKVLIVDDNKDAALSLGMLMDLLGYENRTAYDGMEGLTLADSFSPDVILLDLGMPTMDGFETCRRIRQRSWGHRVIVIAVTGWGQAEHMKMTEAAGFDMHLVKPVPPVELAQKLAEVAETLSR